jgi:hypothetical protein
MGLALLVIDNPVLVKHARSRLRLGQTIPAVAMIVVLSLCAVWVGYYVGWVGSSTAAMFLMGAQIALVTFAGANQLNSALGRARESGVLDFHRVSPLPPSVVALGFFLGAPIREYLLAAVIAPFAAWSAYFAEASSPWKGMWWMARLEVALLATTWLFHSFVMLSCLTRKKPRGSIVGIIMTIIFMIYMIYGTAAGFYFGAQMLLESDLELNFFGMMTPWLPWLLIFELPAIGFVCLACVRKMKAERAHALSKPQAIACLATLVLLAIAGLWNLGRLLPGDGPNEPEIAEVILIAATYVFSLTAMVLAVTITPDANEYMKGLLRASREGRKRPSPWSDQGSNRLALIGLCGLVLLGATCLTGVVGEASNARGGLVGSGPTGAPAPDKSRGGARQAHLSRPIAIGVLTAAYVGLGLQFFSLRSRRSGLVLMGLFLFVAWLLPLLAGAIVGMSGSGDGSSSLVVFALSPAPGLALSSGIGRPPGADSIQLAAVAPPITYAFIFNYLLVVVQRRLDRAARGGGRPEPTQSEPSET